MSIEQTRKFIEKSGCGTITMAILAVVMVAGLFSTAFLGNQAADSQAEQRVIAQVSDFKVSAAQVDRLYQRQSEQMTQAGIAIAPNQQASFYGQAITALVDGALRLELGRKRGIQVTDEQIRQRNAKDIDQSLVQIREQLTLGGRLKAGASEQEVQTALKEATGRDEAEWRKELTTRSEEALKQPDTRTESASLVVSDLLQEDYAKSIQLSDEELKKGFETLVTQRVMLSSFEPANQNVDLKAKAETILKEIQGGLKFDEAVNKYSNDPVPPGKQRKSEGTINLARSVIDADPAYAPLRTLKAGQVSPVINTSSGPAIFRVQKIEIQLPTDFEQKKNDYRQARIREMAFRQINDEMRALRKSGAVTWKSAGFQALYELNVALSDPENQADGKKLAEALEAIESAARTARDAGADPGGPTPAVLAEYLAFDTRWSRASQEERTELRELRVEVLSNVLTLTESTDLRLEVANLALALQDGGRAAEEVRAAASSLNTTDVLTQRAFQQIQALRSRLGTDKLAPAEALQEIDEELKRWRTDAFEQLRNKAELNSDYTPNGQMLHDEVAQTTQELQGMGVLSAAQVKEIQDFQAKWRAEKKKADADAAEAQKRMEEENRKAQAAEKAQAKDAPKAAPKDAPKTNSILPPTTPIPSTGGGQ